MHGIRRMLIAGALLVLPLLSLSAGAVQNEIYGVNVIPGEGIVRIEISKAGDVTFETFTMKDPDRLVINCVGAAFNVPWQEKSVKSSIVSRVRASQFQLEPLLVSRIVVDLTAPVNYELFPEGTKQVVEITSRSLASREEATEASRLIEPREVSVSKTAGEQSETAMLLPAAMGPMLPYVPVRSMGVASAEKKAEQPESTQPRKAAPSESEKESATPIAGSPAPSPKVVEATVESPWIAESSGTEESASQLSVYSEEDNPYSVLSEVQKPKESSRERSYAWGNPPVGAGASLGSNRITVDAQAADIKTVLRTIADYSGKNIVYGPDVKGEVNIHLKNVPWEEALDVILRAHGYGYREEYGMIRVSELSRLMKEELEIQSTERKKDDLLPLMTRIIFVRYSNAEELARALQNIVSQRGKIDVDKNSNALIVIDTEPVIEKVASMVETLDKRTYQVDINAKLIEVDVEATRELGINWGLLNLHSASLGGAGSVDVGERIPVSDGTMKFGMVRSWGELNSVLEMLEKSNKANIISNPRITTMDNREASIIVGKEIPLIVADEAGNPITELTKIGIILRVTPHVNADKTITLDLHPEVSELQSEATAQGGVIISMNEADTRVVVKNGETAVIGGLIKNVKTSYKRGVPVLKDIPILGTLFSSSSTADRKQELVVFVTPTIVE